MMNKYKNMKRKQRLAQECDKEKPKKKRAKRLMDLLKTGDSDGRPKKISAYKLYTHRHLYALTIQRDILPKQPRITIDKCEFKHKNLSVVHTVL